MYQSHLATKTRKFVNQSEESLNAQILQKAGFIEQTMAGVYTYLPLGLRVIQNIQAIVREEMNAIGGQEILMPALHPRSIWDATGRWDTLDVLYRFRSHYTQMDLALGSTHEEVITPLAKTMIQSYKDLPFSLYQIQTKFRDEKRAKSGVLRGREFIMKDLYSFHTSSEDLAEYYEKAQKAYEAIYQRLGLADITYKTYASGGTFSKYSHEYQTVSEAGEDTIHICESCHIAINQEIIEEQPQCPECGNTHLIEKSAIEVGNIFKLETKYSDAFDLTFTNQQGENKPVIMGCYGIGISRLMGTLVEVFAQNANTMQWPASVAPFDTHILILNTDSSEVVEHATTLYNNLLSEGKKVLFDDRDERPGVKFADADLIGIPERIIVSKKSLEQGGYEINGSIVAF